MTDERPTRRVPWCTIALLAACTIVFFAVPGNHRLVDLDGTAASRVTEHDLRFVVRNAAIPCEIVRGRPLTEHEFDRTYRLGDADACDERDEGPRQYPGKHVYLAILVSMFLHGSFGHLFGNMLFLWVFGNDIEDLWGRFRYLILYFVAGLVAAAAHVAIGTGSTEPIVGASGAIAGVMGAYLVCFPRTRVRTLVVILGMQLRKIQAYWVLLVWFALQFLLVGGGTGIAWAAHVGGFAYGAAAGTAWRLSRRRRARRPEPVGELAVP